MLDPFAIGELQSRLSVRKHMDVSHVFLCSIIRSCKEWLKRRSWRLTETVVRLDRRTDRQSRQTKYNRLTRVTSSAICALHKYKVSTCLQNLPLAI